MHHGMMHIKNRYFSLIFPSWIFLTLSFTLITLRNILFCQFPCSHNCETRIFFSQNMPQNPVTYQTSICRPTQKLLTQVPDVCTSTNAETIDSSPSCISFNWRRNYWLTSQQCVLRPSQLLMTHFPYVCTPTVTENKCRHLLAPSKTRIAIMSSLSY